MPEVTATPGKHKILSFLPEIGIGLIILIVGWFAYGAYKKMFGNSQAHEDAVKLGESDALSDNVVNAINKEKSVYRKPITDALIKKYGKSPTADNVKDFTTNVLLPNKDKYGAMIMQVLDAYSHVGSNDAGKIFTVIKNLKSKFEIDAFATDYAIVTVSPSFKKYIPTGKSVLAGDFYKAIDDLLTDADESAVLKIIDAKPLI